MKYQALYRKYRPKNFNEIYGQEIVKKILINSINNNTIGHAYLFYGPRGTGKTSMAKMFARIINCQSLINAEPCNMCKSCIDSLNSECVDIIEIDAASNNGVDEIRELKNKINLVPSLLKYKVYIIDEVHMLSTGAFNALLKTLEEPPDHAIFILATTEIYEVPSTIISRCQLLEFKNIDDNSLKSRLKEIAKLENINIEDNAINEIVKNSNGGLRDAIGLLDKARAFSNDKIIEEDVRKILGVISVSELNDFVDNLIKNNKDELLLQLDYFYNSGYDLTKIVSEIIICLRNKIIQNNEDLYCLINEMFDLENKIIKSSHKKIIFEMYIYNKTNVRIINESECTVAKSTNNTNQIVINNVNNYYVDDNFINTRINNSFFKANKSILNSIKEIWKKLELYKYDSEYGSYIIDLLDAVPVVCSDTNLLLSTKYESSAEKINNNYKIISKLLLDKYNLKLDIIAISNDKWEIEKNKFLQNTKSGIKYTYIEEKKDNNIPNLNQEINSLNTDNLKDKALNLFGNIVE